MDAEYKLERMRQREGRIESVGLLETERERAIESVRFSYMARGRLRKRSRQTEKG